MTLDLLDWCNGPDADGCHFIPEDIPAEKGHLGHCPTCRIVIEEMPDDPPPKPRPLVEVLG